MCSIIKSGTKKVGIIFTGKVVIRAVDTSVFNTPSDPSEYKMPIMIAEIRSSKPKIFHAIKNLRTGFPRLSAIARGIAKTTVIISPKPQGDM
jgi:hypothetical protein